MKQIFFFLILFASLAVSEFSQTAKEDDVQSWNDVQVTAPATKKLDFILMGTFRFGDNVRMLVERRVAVSFNYKLTDWLSIQPIYTNVVTTPKVGRNRTEHRLTLSATYKFPFKKFTLTDRNIVERRLRPPQNSTRYRNRLQFEIPFKQFYDTHFFISDEIFYDSIQERFSRNRFQVGLGKNFNKHLGLDVYYLRQNDATTRPGDLHIIGTVWKIKP